MTLWSRRRGGWNRRRRVGLGLLRHRRCRRSRRRCGDHWWQRCLTRDIWWRIGRRDKGAAKDVHQHLLRLWLFNVKDVTQCGTLSGLRWQRIGLHVRRIETMELDRKLDQLGQCEITVESNSLGYLREEIIDRQRIVKSLRPIDHRSKERVLAVDSPEVAGDVVVPGAVLEPFVVSTPRHRQRLEPIDQLTSRVSDVQARVRVLRGIREIEIDATKRFSGVDEATKTHHDRVCDGDSEVRGDRLGEERRSIAEIHVDPVELAKYRLIGEKGRHGVTRNGQDTDCPGLGIDVHDLDDVTSLP